VTEYLQADRYERTEGRPGDRNGYRSRPWTTRVGPWTLAVPRARDGEFSPAVCDRDPRHETALVCTWMARVVHGVSTRQSRRGTEELCGTEFFQSTVSERAKSLDAAVKQWRTRSLAETPYPFLIVDAMVLKIREHGAVRPRSGWVVTGMNAAGYRDMLGFGIGDSESPQTWSTVWTDLKDRGVTASIGWSPMTIAGCARRSTNTVQVPVGSGATPISHGMCWRPPRNRCKRHYTGVSGPSSKPRTGPPSTRYGRSSCRTLGSGRNGR
jgi:transposase-like protein